MPASGFIRCAACQHDQAAPSVRSGETWEYVSCRWCGELIWNVYAVTPLMEQRYRSARWKGRHAEAEAWRRR